MNLASFSLSSTAAVTTRTPGALAASARRPSGHETTFRNVMLSSATPASLSTWRRAG